MSDYTPTTAIVRNAYADYMKGAEAEFNRWLASVKAKAAIAERERIHAEVKRFVDDLAKHGGDDPCWSDLYQIVRGIETGGKA